MDEIKSKLVFFKEFVKEFEATGSFCSTSPRAAKALTAPMLEDRRKTGLRILEAGPGTGSVTDQILRRMTDDDQLVLCEVNPRMMAALKKSLEKNALFQRHRNRITFCECPVQELPLSTTFDVIICAIPFLNLDFEVVRSIFTRFRELSHEETVLTYYEYMFLRQLGKAVSEERRARLRKLEPFLRQLWRETETSRERVWLNMLPITVYRLDRIGTAQALAA